MSHSSGSKKVLIVLFLALGGVAIFLFASSHLRRESPVNEKNPVSAGESKGVSENDVWRELGYLSQHEKSASSLTAEGVAAQLQGLAQDDQPAKPSQEDIRVQLGASGQ